MYLCMYVCMYVCMYIYIYIYLFIFVGLIKKRTEIKSTHVSSAKET